MADGSSAAQMPNAEGASQATTEQNRSRSFLYPPDSKLLRCSKCNRTLTYITSDGIERLGRTEDHACCACSPFEELYDAMKFADEEFERNRKLALTFRGRFNSLEQVRSAHKHYANFILQLEQPYGYLTESKRVDYMSGKKRRREDESPPSSSRQHSPKRPRRKRVGFHESVIFRSPAEYRDYHAFQRRHRDYEPGRNAAPEGSEWLDTSGIKQTSANYYRRAWNGYRWISETDSEEEDSDDTECEFGPFTPENTPEPLACEPENVGSWAEAQDDKDTFAEKLGLIANSNEDEANKENQVPENPGQDHNYSTPMPSSMQFTPSSFSIPH
ncbi:hypothetical protein CC78DRAFT_538533 [Lojkania enalia]|uniref:Uncharacterized protein n=1 Tax=Lojkania enalia TaxID=147567 RepID=A0A9P4TRU8_9PLEO|nr:hypothetical protein CC78DRAFT_538533 [Didymosphaeria enalia]